MANFISQIFVLCMASSLSLVSVNATSDEMPQPPPAIATKDAEALTAAKNADYETAEIIWKDLAAKGDAEAQNNLGVLYARGNLPPNPADKLNPDEAQRLFSLAAKHGSLVATFNLGEIYRLGFGTKIDERTAYNLYSEAAQKNFLPAADRLAEMIFDGMPTIPANGDMRGALRLFHMLANNKDNIAQWYLANHDVTSAGDRINNGDAREWLRESGSLGNSRAAYAYGAALSGNDDNSPGKNDSFPWFYRAAMSRRDQTLLDVDYLFQSEQDEKYDAPAAPTATDASNSMHTFIGTQLSGPVYEYLPSVTHGYCLAACVADSQCTSYSFITGRRECSLYEVPPGDPIKNQWSYFAYKKQRPKTAYEIELWSDREVCANPNMDIQVFAVHVNDRSPWRLYASAVNGSKEDESRIYPYNEKMPPNVPRLPDNYHVTKVIEQRLTMRGNTFDNFHFFVDAGPETMQEIVMIERTLDKRGRITVETSDVFNYKKTWCRCQ